jgi:hypothetical protein
MTAGVILEKMTDEQQVTFIAGIVEGLAHARYVNDNKAPEGRDCIYDWYYGDKATIGKIVAAFERYKDAMPGAIVGTLAVTKCGA